MSRRPYYSIRTGKNPEGKHLALPALKVFVISVLGDFWQRGFFQEAFGYECVDEGHVDGLLGPNIENFVLLALRKDNLWPPKKFIDFYTEDDLFDILEFQFDHVSAPTEGSYHAFCDCGMHFSKFDRAEGQQVYRRTINALLHDYGDGFELSENGEIVILPSSAARALMATPLRGADQETVSGRVEAAIRKFRSRGSTWDDRRDAIRDLADVLEYLRPQAKRLLHEKDERDLFELVNRFGIRHHNQNQLTKYDKATWLSWMFHYYLATIHAMNRLIQKQRE